MPDTYGTCSTATQWTPSRRGLERAADRLRQARAELAAGASVVRSTKPVVVLSEGSPTRSVGAPFRERVLVNFFPVWNFSDAGDRVRS